VRSRAVAAAVLIAGTLAGCGSSAQPGPPPSPDALRVAEAQIISLLDDTRTEAGLPALVRDSAIDAVARSWSTQLAASGVLDHNPEYAQQIPDGWTESGENVGWLDPADHRLADLAAEVHQAWLDSPTHRANLVDPAYTAVGVGIAYDEAHGFYVTQDFAAYPS